MSDDFFEQLDQLQRGAHDLNVLHHSRHADDAEHSSYHGHNQHCQPQYSFLDSVPQINEGGYLDEPMHLDSFDEQLLRQPAQDSRQWQAAQGYARLSLPPAASQGIARTDAYHRALPIQESALQRPTLSNFAFNHTDSTSPGHPNRLSSPAFSASQRHPAPYEDAAAAELSQPAQVQASRAGPIRYQPRLAQLSNGQSSDSDDHLHLPTLPAKRYTSVPNGAYSRPSNSSTPIVQGIQLVSTRELPDRFRAIFNFPLFNAVQSKCFPVIFRTNDNFVLSSPTGSGKTAILELAICRLVHGFTSGSFKIVYMAPTKSLCSERVRDWQSRFGTLDLQCAELTGDTDNAQLRNVQHASIIITTPEKWDSMTRKWKDHQKLMQMVKLFLIDEVHILKEDRGPTLEAVVSRMKSVDSDVRFIALSATVPNSQDIATWLGKDSMNPQIPAPRERFGEEFRPVRLQKHVCGYQSGSNDFAFEKMLDSRLTEIIAKYSQSKPLMVFCMTRKSCSVTARLLADWWNSSTGAQNKYWSQPRARVVVKDKDLIDTTASGVAFHHAGLTAEDRAAVEKGYLAGELSVICCTSTLAVGVNLPCHMVIIKSTVSYTNGGVVKEYSDLEIMQMLGRAGRPQFDDSAVAVIMTRLNRVAFYETMMAGSEVLESCLHEYLIDHLNAEIGLGTVTNAASARKWLAGTFLYVRLKDNPQHYKLDGEGQGRTLEERLEHICKQGIASLREHDLVRGVSNLQCSELGDSMARYYIQFDTMKQLLALKPKAKISEILLIISQAAEFKDIRFRAGEKPFYKDLNKNPSMKFPIPVNIDLTAHKVSLILQSVLGCIDIPTEEVKHRHEYNANKAVIFQHAHRLIRCIIDCQLYFEDSVSARNALMLARSFGAQVWDDSPLHMKQLDGIGLVGVRKLVAAGLTSIEALASTESGRIEKTLTRNPPFGSLIQQKAAAFPQLRVSLKTIGNPVIKKGEGVCVKVRAEIGLLNEKVPDFFNRKPVYICLLVDTSDGRKAHFVRVSAKKMGKGQELPFSVNLTAHGQVIRGYLMCDEIAGTQRTALLKPEIPAFMFPPVKAQAESSEESARYANAPNTSKRRAATSTPRASGETDDEFGDGAVDDAILAAADFTNIEDFDDDGNEKQSHAQAKSKPKPSIDRPESTQMPNGRWTCNHVCKNKMTCKHGACCREGLEKKPKASKAKEAKKSDHSSQPRQTQLDLSKTRKQPVTASAQPPPTSKPAQSKQARDLDALHNSIQTSTKHVPVLKGVGRRPSDAPRSSFVSPMPLDSNEFAFDVDEFPSDQDILGGAELSRDGSPEMRHKHHDSDDDMLDMPDDVHGGEFIEPADTLIDLTNDWNTDATASHHVNRETSTGGMSPLTSLERAINSSTVPTKQSASSGKTQSIFISGESTDSIDDSLALISGALQDDAAVSHTSKRAFEDTAPDDASQFFSNRNKQRKLSGMEPMGVQQHTASWQPMTAEATQSPADTVDVAKPELKVKEEESIEDWFKNNLGTEFFTLI
ncbi:putative helicase, Sec63 domain, Helicase superfamily 1/2, ATP-binding domain-containing protein [Septoria linicola]|nr:putative helicase, Sec63 domain, Helicase superfamily 1/2, ATP-binding domain-containing protein [Septoria linicola]